VVSAVAVRPLARRQRTTGLGRGSQQFKPNWTCAGESSRFDQRVIKCQRRPSVEHRGISFSVVEMSFPRGWKWTVGKGKTVSVGVCATRLDAIRQAQTFIDAVVDWAA
jgi:hypothetical protein